MKSLVLQTALGNGENALGINVNEDLQSWLDDENKLPKLQSQKTLDL